MSAIPKMTRTPLFENGDRLDADEFRRWYVKSPHVRKAELIGGEVHLPSPVTLDDHGEPHVDASTWLGTYKAYTHGVGAGDNATVRLDIDNEPQPDLVLFVRPECSGQAEIDADGYIVGAPELVFEVSASSRSIDLGRKMNVYRRHRVREYVVWRTADDALDWFVLRRGRFAPLAADKADGLFKCLTFPGLWLDAAALVRRDLATVLAALTRGVQSPAHAKFVTELAARRRPR